MFADPQSVTYSTVAKSLPAVGRGTDESSYKINDSGVIYTMKLGRQFKKRNRVVARLQRDSYASDPVVPSQNILASMTASFTLDFPNLGLTTVDAQNLGKALRDWLTDANILRLANGET